MFRTTPRVESGRLYHSETSAETILVGTTAWYDWLEQHTLFTLVDRHYGYFLAHKRGAAPAEQEWDASRTREGRLERFRLGPSRALTLARLHEAARTQVDQLPADGAPLAGSAFSEPQPPDPTEYWSTGGSSWFGLPGSPLGGQLARPRLPADVIARPRLLARLDGGLAGSLTLVCAPAGYGKTTLLVQWLATLPHPAVWLSLTPANSDLPRFVQALVFALQRAVPGVCPASAHLLDAPRFPPLAEVLALLADELADLPSDLVVVLDDAHLLEPGSDGHTLLASLLEHPPAPLRLVLSARTPPPLAPARWRAAPDAGGDDRLPGAPAGRATLWRAGRGSVRPHRGLAGAGAAGGPLPVRSSRPGGPPATARAGAGPHNV